MKKNVKNLIPLTFNLNPFKIANFILHQAYDVHTAVALHTRYSII